MKAMNIYKCLVCGQPAPLYDVVDFNKSCEEYRGQFLPLSGHAVYYARCGSCNYTFAPEFGFWTDQDFLEKIYNEDYIKVDPDYLDKRQQENAVMLNNFFGAYRMHINHLDYGGGNGRLAQLLRGAQWQSVSYDPFPKNNMRLSDLGTFNLITAFEVFEHVPDPHGMMENISKLLEGQDSMVFFSTGISDGLIKDKERLNWWYAAPRNGHIGIHTAKSLKVLGQMHNLNFASMGTSFHAYYRDFPQWAEKLTKL